MPRTFVFIMVMTGILTFVALTPPPAEAHGFSSLIVQHSGQCMDVYGGSLAIGAPVIQWPCHGGANQQATLTRDQNGWYEIKFRHSGLCLDVPNLNDFVQLYQYSCHGGDNQRFSVALLATYPGVSANLHIRFGGKCADVWYGSTAAGAAVIQYPCHSGGNQQWRKNDDVRHKMLGINTWYQRVSDSGSYATWMTMSAHRHYSSSSIQNLWAGPIATALSGWNNANLPGGKTTVYITNYIPAFWHDIHAHASQDGCWADLDVNGDGLPDRSNCASSSGQIFMYDQNFERCDFGRDQSMCPPSYTNPGPRSDNWWYVIAALNENFFQFQYGGRTASDQNYIRTAIAAHEHGHALTLRHDRTLNDPEFFDQICGGSIPVTIMDERCGETITVNQGTAWDACGINHAFFDPSWGFSGC